MLLTWALLRAATKTIAAQHVTPARHATFNWSGIVAIHGIPPDERGRQRSPLARAKQDIGETESAFEGRLPVFLFVLEVDSGCEAPMLSNRTGATALSATKRDLPNY
jgi:hypothetical protein